MEGASLHSSYWRRNWAVQRWKTLPKATQLVSSSAGTWNQHLFLSIHHQHHPGHAEWEVLKTAPLYSDSLGFSPRYLTLWKGLLETPRHDQKAIFVFRRILGRQASMGYGWAQHSIPNQKEGSRLLECRIVGARENRGQILPQRGHLLRGLAH